MALAHPDKENAKFLETAEGLTAVRTAEMPINFGAVSNLGQNLNDESEFANDNGFNTIGFYCSPPTGGTVTFETTYDDINWEPTSIRGVTDDTVASTISTAGNFVGSIAGNRSFRFKTTTAGSASGTAMGRIQRNTAVVENIEFQAAPHKVGYPTQRHHDSFTSAQTDTVLWTPATGKKVIVTDLFVFAYGSTDGRITVFVETNANGNIILNTEVSVSVIGPWNFNHQYKLGIVGGVDEEIKVTTGAAIDCDIVVMGYEV